MRVSAISSQLLAALRPAIAHGDPAARAAAVRTLGKIGGAEAAKLALETGRGDKSARVRIQAVLAVALLRGIDEEAVAFLAERLATDPDESVRIEAAVEMGRKGSQGAVEPLIRALQDPKWEVAACAAVSEVIGLLALGEFGGPEIAPKPLESTSVNKIGTGCADGPLSLT